MNFGLSFLFAVVSFLGLGLVTAGVAYLVIKLRSGEAIDLASRSLLSIYLRLITIVSLMVLAVGLSGLVNTGLASILGRDFSYSASPVYREGSFPAGVPLEKGLPSPEEQQRQREEALESNFRGGLAEGISLTLVGGLIWALHLWGQSSLRRHPGGEEPVLHRIYLAVLLVIFSLGGILALSQGVSDTVRYILVGGAAFYTYRPPPGGSLSTAIVFVPIWVYYFATLWRELRPREAPA